MKKVLMETPEEVPYSCIGCVFFSGADICFTPICQRLRIKQKDCIGKIYTLIDPSQKKKKSKSTKK